MKKEIKHFHPTDKPLPNGSCIQKGGNMLECRANANSFVVDDIKNKRL